jgi:cardiolipin synthase
LLDAGVEIWEYPLGLLHSKSLTIDGEVALVGSANMDRRSLELNYENNVLIADSATVSAIRQRQEEYRQQSQAVDRQAVENLPITQRFVQNAMAMLAPIL